MTVSKPPRIGKAYPTTSGPRNSPHAGSADVLLTHPSADLYGSDRVLLATVDALRDSGRAVVVALPAPGPLVAELQARGARVSYCPSPVLRKSALRPAGALRLVGGAARSVIPGVRLIRSSDAEIILVNTITIPLWLVLAKLLGRRSLCHVHEAEGSASLVVRRAVAAPLLLADRLVSNSQFSRSVLVGAFSTLGDRTTVVPNAVPGPVEGEIARSALAGGLRLLFVGRLSPRKGPDVAIAALALLRAAGVDAKLDLVGAVFPGYEWFAAELAADVAARNLADSVTFHGFQSDVWPFLAAADVVVVPSKADEPFGNTAVEAVLASRPVVVSATSGLLEAVDGYVTARCVAPDDAGALATALHEVIDQWPSLRLLAAQDAALARQRHDPARYGLRLREVIDELMAAAPPRNRRVSSLHAVANSMVAANSVVAADSVTAANSVVVAIVTYNRLDELVRTVPLVAAQLADLDLAARVLVVDNDARGSAEQVVSALGLANVSYVVEPVAGIAAARNRALDEAGQTGDDLLVFIDDDERPTRGWLAGLVDEYRKTRPAAVVGPVVSEFAGPVESWITAGGFFDRRRLPTGTEVTVAATNNLLLDVEQIAELELRFDERFGLTGGSDTLFSKQLSATGARMVWCDHAIVVDHVPLERMTRRWVLNRAMRYGNSASRTAVVLADGTVARSRVRVEMLLRGAARVGLGAARMTAGSAAGNERHRARGQRVYMKGRGYIMGALDRAYTEYARPPEG